MNLKELKKLAAACRKAGISHFKSADYEFTLTEEEPKSTYKLNKAASTGNKAESGGKFESDSLTDEELLYWSVGSAAEILGAEENKK